MSDRNDLQLYWMYNSLFWDSMSSGYCGFVKDCSISLSLQGCDVKYAPQRSCNRSLIVFIITQARTFGGEGCGGSKLHSSITIRFSWVEVPIFEWENIWSEELQTSDKNTNFFCFSFNTFFWIFIRNSGLIRKYQAGKTNQPVFFFQEAAFSGTF